VIISLAHCVDARVTTVNRKQPHPLNLAVPSEDDVQIAVIDWCRLHHDERRMTLHIPNEGKRSKLGHIKQVRKGLIPGAADLFIPGARAGWHGLYLELKSLGKTPTPDQQQFGKDMNACGYAWAWADGVDKAIAIIERYMAGQQPRPNWVHYEAPAKVGLT